MPAHNLIRDVSEVHPISFWITLDKYPTKKNIGFEAIYFEQPNTEEKTMSMERHIQNVPS